MAILFMRVRVACVCCALCSVFCGASEGAAACHIENYVELTLNSNRIFCFHFISGSFGDQEYRDRRWCEGGSFC